MTTPSDPLQYLETALTRPLLIKWATFSRALIAPDLTEPDLRHVLYLATSALLKARWTLRKLDLWKTRATNFGVKHADELNSETETETVAFRVWRDDLDLEAPAMAEGRAECVKAVEKVVMDLQKAFEEVGESRQMRERWRKERG